MSSVRLGALALLVFALGAAAVRGQAVNWPSESPPRPISQREAKFPPYQVKLLGNGMQVVTVSHHEQPSVSVRLLVRAGAVHNPAGKPGVASMAAALLDQGTTTKSAAQIADQIDYIGGALGTGAGSDLSFVNAVVMKDSFDVAMDLMADIVRNPAFAPEELERQKQQALSSLQVSRTDAAYVASSVFDRLVFGFHPYGQPNTGTPETLARITRADLQAYHKAWFVPNNMLLAIVGDVTSDEALATAERVFGKWARVDLPVMTVPEPPPATRRVIVVDMPGAVQTEVRVGQIGIPRKHNDYLPMDLAIRILGGEGANRLHRVLRSERGLTYGAQADSEMMKLSGNFVAETNTKTSTTGEVLRLIFDEYAKMQRDRVGERELGDAQAYVAGAFPLTIEIPDAIATQVLNTLFYELPLSDVGTFAQRVQSVTPEDIQRVARQYIHPDRLSVVLVGDSAAFLPQLKAIGVTNYEVIPFDQLDVTSASLKKESPRASLAPGGAAGGGVWPVPGAAAGRRPAYAPQGAVAGADSRARDVIDRAVVAKGGLATLKGVRTLVAEATTTFQTPQGPVSSSSTSTVAYPDRMRVDGKVANVSVVQAYNAGTAWVSDPSGVHDVPAEMGEGFADSMRRDLITLLVGAAQGTTPVRLLPEEGAEGLVLTVLEVNGTADADRPMRLWLDAKGHVARLAFAGVGPDGRAARMEERFSDYRDVSGVQIPFRSELRQNGKVVAESVFTRVTINAPVDATRFDKPRR
ncbi:MAG: pitrilysin family protein [Vicinamibacterales bacterium]